MKREFDPEVPELMDRPQPVSDELRVDLENLRSLNQWFGAWRLMRFFLKRWTRPGGTYRFLDLATGSADLPLAAVRWADRHAVRLQWDAVDNQPATLEIAGETLGGGSGIRLVHGDILTWEPDATYDAVFCNLALHHFSDADAATILRRMNQFTHGGVVAADLRGGWELRAGIWLLTTLLYRAPMTRHDARLSARRAFSGREFQALAKAAGWAGSQYRRFAFQRQAVWMDPDQEIPGRPRTK